jgi:hypothetical protein
VPVEKDNAGTGKTPTPGTGSSISVQARRTERFTQRAQRKKERTQRTALRTVSGVAKRQSCPYPETDFRGGQRDDPV